MRSRPRPGSPMEDQNLGVICLTHPGLTEAVAAAGGLRGFASVMRVGLQRDRTVRQVMVMTGKGNCLVYADGVKKGELQASDGLRIELGTTGLTARSLSMQFTAKQKVEVVPQTVGGGFRLRLLDPKQAERTYPGSLEVSAVGRALQLVDRVPLEAYTAGVVSAEGGILVVELA